MAPEIFCKDKVHGPPADWFAAGVTFHRMLCGAPPFKSTKPTRRKDHKTTDWTSVKFPARQAVDGYKGPISKDLMDFIDALVEIDPTKRLSSTCICRRRPTRRIPEST